jgi:hypothetical protein
MAIEMPSGWPVNFLEDLAAFRTGRGSRRETFPHPVADILNLIADLAADFFATRGSKQQSRADSHAYAGHKSKHVANGVIVARIHIFCLVTQIRNPI